MNLAHVAVDSKCKIHCVCADRLFISNFTSTEGPLSQNFWTSCICLHGMINSDFFLPRDAMRNRGLCCRPVSVYARPSECLSLTLVYCIQTAEDIVKLFLRPGSPINLVFFWNRSADTGELLQREREIQGVGKFCDFRLKSRHCAKMYL